MATLRRLLRWCGFHVHDWTEWQIVGPMVLIRDESVVGELQIRHCKTCKKRQTHRINF